MRLSIEHTTSFTYTQPVRDYADAAPLRGVYQGRTQATLDVRVRIRRAIEAYRA